MVSGRLDYDKGGSHYLTSLEGKKFAAAVTRHYSACQTASVERLNIYTYLLRSGANLNASVGTSGCTAGTQSHKLVILQAQKLPSLSADNTVCVV